jgi:hypothetical protein
MLRFAVSTPEVILVHPNRDKPASKATKAVIILLLLISAGLMALVAIGGWDALAGQKAALIAYIILYVVLAYYSARWKRGVLPLAASLAIIMAIFAAVSGPGWFERDKTGFTSPLLPESLLGLLTYLILPVQVLLIVFAARGFSQDWHVEVEQQVGHHGVAPGHEPEPSAA